MKKIDKYFNNEQLNLLKNIGIQLNSDKDYTDDDLFEIHDIITESYIEFGFDKNDEPKPIAKIYEEIIDIFYDKLSI